MGSMYVPVCPQKRWLRHCNAIKKHSYTVQEEDIIKRYYIIDINKTIYSFFFTFIEISIKKKLKYEDYPLKAIFTPITDEVSFHQKDGFGLHISYFLYLFFASFLL